MFDKWFPFFKFFDIHFDRKPGGFIMKKSFKLLELGCANCAAKMETAIARLPDVQAVNIAFMTQAMTLEAPDDRFDSVLAEAKAVIRKIEPDVVVK